MAPKRLIIGENKPQPQLSTSGFTGITPGDELSDVFMDGDLSSNE